MSGRDLLDPAGRRQKIDPQVQALVDRGLSFSVITVGAPIMQTGATRASSSKSSTSTRRTLPCRRIASCAISLPI